MFIHLFNEKLLTLVFASQMKARVVKTSLVHSKLKMKLKEYRYRNFLTFVILLKISLFFNNNDLIRQNINLIYGLIQFIIKMTLLCQILRVVCPLCVVMIWMLLRN